MIFFRANTISEDDQVAIFLSYIGVEAYDLLRNLQAPNLLLNTDLAVVIKTLEEHFEPKPNVINKGFKFHMRTR